MSVTASFSAFPSPSPSPLPPSPQLVAKAAKLDRARQVMRAIIVDLHTLLLLLFLLLLQLEYELVAYRCAGIAACLVNKGKVRFRFETCYKGVCGYERERER